MLNVSIVDDERELDALRADWNGLLDDSASDTVFLTWEWLTAWWRSYGAGKSLRVLKIEEQGRLVALIPFYREDFRRYGFSYRSARFVGDGSSDSDYLDIIVRRGSEAAVVAALKQFASGDACDWDVLHLNEVPEHSSSLGPLRTAFGAQGWYWMQTEVPCAYVVLPRTWDELLKQLKPRMRTKVRSLTSQLERDFGARMELCESADELPVKLEHLFELHARRWHGKNQAGVFVSEAKRRFYYDVSRVLLDRGWLRLYSLKANDRFVAHQYCFEYKRTMFLLQEGFDPDWEEHGVGNVLRALVFRNCIERGVGVYDFLGGVTSHKMSWGAAEKSSLRIAVARASFKNSLLFRVPAAVDQAKRVARTKLPPRVIEWAKTVMRA